MTVDRAQFTPDGLNPDCPVPFGPNQTVPTEQMARLLADAVGSVDSVLEIGTGSGYQAAVLAERCKEVVSIEIQPLPEGVREKLPENVTLIHGDGCTYDTGEQFDAVLVTFAVKNFENIAMVWIKQVRDGGKLIVPIEYRGGCMIRVFDSVMEYSEIIAYAPFTEQVNA